LWVLAPLGQTKDYQIGTCCFPTKHAALRIKSKDWLSKQYNNLNKRVGLLQSGPHHFI
jgi:hypothetical protein